MKKILVLIFAVCMSMLFYISALAENIDILKLTDIYALRENGELVQYRETADNMVARVALEVRDFNNSIFITKDGLLHKTDGTVLAYNAKSLAVSAPFIDGKYNGEYVYISENNRLIAPAADGYSERVLCSEASEVYGNLVLKTDGSLSALVDDMSGGLKEVHLLDNVTKISGENGEYTILDNAKTCWFIPLADNKFIYDYETLKLEERVESCDGLDRIISNESIWQEYDRSALRSGRVSRTVKSEKALLVYGNYIYITTGRDFSCYYNGKEYRLTNNARQAYQHKRGSMNGYFLDLADTLYRNVQQENNFTSIEVASSIYEIMLAGEDYCIAADQNGLLYGIDKAVTFGTGKIDENSAVTSVLLPLSQKTTEIFINDSKIQLSRRIIEKDGRTLYPFREIAEMLGAEVTWDDSGKIVTAALGGKTVKFTVGEGAYEINGERRRMDAVPVIDELTGSLYVPMRYTAEALGFNVEWKSGEYENTIVISK